MKKHDGGLFRVDTAGDRYRLAEGALPPPRRGKIWASFTAAPPAAPAPLAPTKAPVTPATALERREEAFRNTPVAAREPRRGGGERCTRRALFLPPSSL